MAPLKRHLWQARNLTFLPDFIAKKPFQKQIEIKKNILAYCNRCRGDNYVKFDL